MRTATMGLIFAVLAATGVAGASQTQDNQKDHGGAIPRTDPCIVYTYDANGNRTSQSITTSGGALSPVWGTGVWGCFVWTPH
jgi:hypothetical protein